MNYVAIADIHLGQKPIPTYKYDQETYDQGLMECILKADKLAMKMDATLLFLGDTFHKQNVSWRYINKLTETVSLCNAKEKAFILGPGHECQPGDYDDNPLRFAIDIAWRDIQFVEDQTVYMLRPDTGKYANACIAPTMNRPDFIEWCKTQEFETDAVFLHGPMTPTAPFPHVKPSETKFKCNLCLAGDIHYPWKTTHNGAIFASPGSIGVSTSSDLEFEATAIVAKQNEDKSYTVVQVPLTTNRAQDYVPKDKLTSKEKRVSLAIEMNKEYSALDNVETIVWDIAKKNGLKDEALNYLQEKFEEN